MNWRDTLIGSGITLIVTVFAGLLVYYLTKEPTIAPLAEHLVYTVQTSATFGTAPDKITFLTIRVENTGGKSAHNVRTVVDLGHDITLQSKQITFSSGSATSITDISSETNVDILVPDLVPTEAVVISLLIKGSGSVTPNVNVKSTDSVGQKASASLQRTETDHTVKSPTIFGIVILASGIFALTIYILTTNLIIPKFISRPRRYSERDGLNNTAFVLIQEGLIDEAHVLLSKAIAIGRGDSHSFANYGLVRGLEGDSEGARKHFDIAKWWGTDTP